MFCVYFLIYAGNSHILIACLHLELVLVLEAAELVCVLLALVDGEAEFGHEAAGDAKEGGDHEADEADLAAGEVHGVAVAEHGDFEAKRTLLIALVVELAHNLSRPLERNVEGASGISNVRRVDHRLHHGGLVLGVQASLVLRELTYLF